jgi:lysyl-tRNA synthetase class 2
MESPLAPRQSENRSSHSMSIEETAAKISGASRGRPAEPGVTTAIRSRADLLRSLRHYFDHRGFLEVQPPCLDVDCVVDAYLDPIVVEPETLRCGDHLPGKLFLQTSPESAMKQMLAAGAPSVYSIGPVFRSGELGPWHRVEFTMLEWYEVSGNLESAIDLAGNLAAEILGSDGFDVRDYRGLFREQLGLDPIEAGLESLTSRVASIDGELAGSLARDRDGLLDVLLSQTLQPRLGHERPLVLKNYPFSQAALAKRSPDDPDCAARFELFAAGVELANGYDELLDADELVSRAETNNRHRVKRGLPPLAVQTRLVEAMRAGLPPCAGVALGVDRLQMIRDGDADLGRCAFSAIRPL